MKKVDDDPAWAHQGTSPFLFHVGAGNFSVVEDVAKGVHALAVQVNGIVDVRAGRATRISKQSDNIATLDLLADLECRLPKQMTIHRPESVAVVQRDVVSDASVSLDLFHDTGCSGQDVGSAVARDVDATVELVLARVWVRTIAVPI